MSRSLRILISAGLLCLLISLVDWSLAWYELRNLPVAVMVTVTGIFAIQYVISAWKWQTALLVLNVHAPFMELVRIYFIGAFFSNFLPSNVGGDVYRAYRTAKHSSLLKSSVIVILERLIGLIALLIIAVIGAVWLVANSIDLPMSLLITSVALIVASYFALPLGATTVLHRTTFWHKYLPARLTPMVLVVARLANNRRRTLALLATCLLYQVIAVIPFVLLFAGVGVKWAVAESAVANGAGSVAAILPISFNGLGIMEASFAGAAAQLGIGLTEATVVSLMIRILALPLLLLFGVLYMFEGRFDRRAIPGVPGTELR